MNDFFQQALDTLMQGGTGNAPPPAAPVPAVTGVQAPALPRVAPIALEMPDMPALPAAITNPTPAPAPPVQAAPTGVDYSQFQQDIDALAPEAPEDEEFNKWREMLFALAGGLAQGENVGQGLAIAAGMFGQAQKQTEARNKAANEQYEQQMRAHELQKAEIGLKIEEAKAELANATTQVEYNNALNKWQAALAEQESTRQSQLMRFEIESQRAMQELDLDMFNAGQVADANRANANLAQQEFSNQLMLEDRAIAQENREQDIAREEARFRSSQIVSTDGGIAIMGTRDENGNFEFEQVPLNPFAQDVAQAEIMNVVAPGTGDQFLKTQQMSKMGQFPEGVQRQIAIGEVFARGLGKELLIDEEITSKDVSKLTSLTGDILGTGGPFDIGAATRGARETAWRLAQKRAEENLTKKIESGAISPASEEEASRMMALELVSVLSAQGLIDYDKLDEYKAQMIEGTF